MLEAGRLQEGLRTGSSRKSGQPLKFTIQTISGYSDWDASLQIITQELKQVGIAVTVQDENSGPYTTNLQGGQVPAGVRRQRRSRAEPRPEPVLRAARLAVQRQHRLDQLRAVQFEVDRRAVQPVSGRQQRPAASGRSTRSSR